MLTDPNFVHAGERVYLGKGLWTKRLTEPAAQPEDLPALDALVLSHLHGDHFDRVARRGLDPGLPVVTTTHAARRLRRWGFRAADGLHPWEVREFRRDGTTLRVQALPAHHAPGPAKALLPPVMGSLLEFRSTTPGAGSTAAVADRSGRARIYISGDTLLGRDTEEIAARCPLPDLALVHLGGTRVFGLTVTMDAKMGARLVSGMNPSRAIPIHFDDYKAFKSPLADFRREIAATSMTARIAYLGRGETWHSAGSARGRPEWA